MKQIKQTVTIGISAYNEENNIKQLISSLLTQNRKTIKLREIIIFSDGSTDRTCALIRSFKNRKIILIANKERLGKVNALNVIMKKSDSDILVVLDADVIPSDANFLANITAPFLRNKKIGLVGADTKSKVSNTVFENAIGYGHTFKNEIFKKIKHGNNVLMCHGRALAFSLKLYKSLHLFYNHPTDAQSYFLCMTKGFKFKFQPKATVFFRSPKTLSDHKRQHNRFISGIKSFENIFPVSLIRTEYHIPTELLIKTTIKFFLNDPPLMICYIAITLYLSVFKSINENYKTIWVVSKSTKVI